MKQYTQIIVWGTNSSDDKTYAVGQASCGIAEACYVNRPRTFHEQTKRVQVLIFHHRTDHLEGLISVRTIRPCCEVLDAL